MDRHSELICPICQDYFDNVVETSCCSTGYCLQCLDESLSATNGTCPSCRQPLDTFKCVPNKLVQRMVDNLPAECLYCSSQLTRSIFQEHTTKCENRPKSVGVECERHHRPLTRFCLQDGINVCELCTTVGTHRHHLSTNRELREKKEMQLNMITYASLVCHDGGVPVTVENVLKILDAAGCSVEDPNVIDLFVNHSHRFEEWMNLSLSSPAPTFDPIHKMASDSSVHFDEKAAAAEYEALKEKYHNEQFNFEGVQIKAIPISSLLLPKVKNHLYILMEIRVGKKKEETGETTPPYAVSIVLDRSGSMAGSKLNKAKDAIKGVIENLSPKDLLHLVQYDNNASVVFRDGTSLQKTELLSMVDSVQAMGCTNLSDGTELGFKLLQEQNTGSDMIKRIFLFSDGCANAGIQTHQGICELIDGYYRGGVGTSAFGIGDDFDERLMRGVSESGRGHYFFIDSSDKIPAMLEKAFRGLSRTVATNVLLRIKGTKGRQIKKLHGSDDLFKGIVLGDMREKDLKQVLVQVEIEEEASDEPIEILEFELSYDRKDDCVPEGPLKGNLTMRTSTNLEEVTKLNDEVLIYLRIHECGELDKTVVKLMESNKIDEALQLKRQVVKTLEDLVPKDKIGFAKVLLLRARNRLFDLEQLKSRKSAKSFASVKKEIDRDAKEEDDEDMGFGLFD